MENISYNALLLYKSYCSFVPALKGRHLYLYKLSICLFYFLYVYPGHNPCICTTTPSMPSCYIMLHETVVDSGIAACQLMAMLKRWPGLLPFICMYMYGLTNENFTFKTHNLSHDQFFLLYSVYNCDDQIYSLCKCEHDQ